MNLGHQVETAELSDTDLDGIAGGLSVAGVADVTVETSHVDVCADVNATSSAAGLTVNGNLNVAVN